MKTRGNDMKKFYSLFASLFAAASLFAGGDIYEIRPCDQFGISKNYGFDVDVNPARAGQQLYFNIRLCSREQNNDKSLTEADRSHFELEYNGTPGWESYDRIYNAFSIGVVVSGKTRYARLVDLVKTPSSVSGRKNTYNLTDLIFELDVETGDLALPIKLAQDDNGTPAGEDDSGLAYVMRNYIKWSVVYYPQKGGAASDAVFEFKPPTEYKPEQTWLGDLSESDYANKMNTNYSLKDCGFWTRTVDFDGRLETSTWEKPGDYWRGVAEGVPQSEYVTSEQDVPVTNLTELWVWAVDRDWFAGVTNNLAEGKQPPAWVEPSVTMTGSGSQTISLTVGYDGTVPRRQAVKAYKVQIVRGSYQGPFTCQGVPGRKGDKALLVLSGNGDFLWNVKTGNTFVKDSFLTVPVACVEPPLPSLTITRQNPLETDVDVTSDYMTPVSHLTVTLVGRTFSNNMTVVVAPVMTAGAAYPTNRYARISVADTSDGWKQDGLLELPLLKDKREARIDVFGMGAKSGVTDGAHAIEFRIVGVKEADAQAFLTGGWDSKTFLRFNPTTPVMTKPEAGFIDTATRGDAYTLAVGIEDNWYNTYDTGTCYQVWVAVKRSTAAWKNTWTCLGSNFVIAADKCLYQMGADGLADWTKPPTYTFTQTGKNDMSIKVVAPNGETSPVAQLARNVDGRLITVNVQDPDTADAFFYSDQGLTVECDEFCEGAKSYGYVKVELFSAEPYGSPLWAYLAPKDANEIGRVTGSCLTNTVGGHGIPIPSSKLVSDKKYNQLTFVDGAVGGSKLDFDVILCESDTFRADSIVTRYVTGTGTKTLTVTNAEPVVKEMRMSGKKMSPLPGAYVTTSKGVEKKFTFSVDDLSQVDRNATDLAETSTAHAMRFKYAIFEGCDDDFTGGEAMTIGPEGETEMILEGPALYNFKTNFVHTFDSIGRARIEVCAMDKDMYNSDQGVWTETVSYGIEISDKPSVWVESDLGNVFDETAPGQRGGVPLRVKLSEKYTKSDLDVLLTVTPPADAKPGMMLLGGSGVTKLSANTYSLTIKAGQTEYPPSTSAAASSIFNVSAADGTAASAAIGFDIKAEVTTTGTEPTYEPESRTFLINNVEPTVAGTIPDFGAFELVGSSGDQNTKTNAIPVSIGEAPPITWRVNDVTNDLAGKITVSWTSPDRTSGTLEITDTADHTFTPKFNLAGFYKISVSATDKDGGVTTAQWWYEVQSSKTLITRAHGPFGGSADALSARYSNAAGLGAGHTYSTKLYSGASRWCIIWNCGTDTSAGIYAWGYEPGAVDNGTLDNSMDVALDANGNNATTSPSAVFSPYYQNTLEKCSYFYRWVPINVAEEAAEQTIFKTLAPAKQNADGTANVNLPGEKDDAGNYAQTIVEAVFSQEFLKTDNMGDINADGIPDAYVTHADYAEGFGIVNVGGTLVDGANDLANLAAFNDDGDFFPVGFAGGSLTFIPGPTNTWEGRPFLAKYEIRGYADPDRGLSPFNDAPALAGVLGVTPDKHYTDPATDPDSTLSALEYDAFLLSGMTAEQWSPERPTNPTKADTDDDGIPDGYEYYVWYKATVGWMDGTDHKFLSGRAYNPQNPFAPTYISPKELADKFDPIVDGSRDWDTIDTDNDGILDIVEFTLGTNPFDYDTDGDGLPDGYEVFVTKTNPCSADTNNNGISDAAENDDNDSMAVYPSFLNVVGVANNGDVDYYGCLTTTNFTYAYENKQTYASFLTVKTNGNEVTETRYIVKSAPATTDRGALKADCIAYVLRAVNASTNCCGRPVRFTRGTVVTQTNEVDNVYEQRVTAPEDCYVVWQCGGNVADGGLALGKKVAAGTAIAGIACYQPTEPLKVYLLHHQVYAALGFDPRTAWNHDAAFAPTINTAAYTHFDEFLSMTFFYRTGGIAAGDMVQNLTASPKKTMLGIWNANSTHPLKADTDGDQMPDGWEFYLMAGSGMLQPDSNYSPIYPFSGPKNVTLEDKDPDKDDLQWPAEYSGITSSARYSWSPTYPLWRNKLYPTDPWDEDTDDDGMLDGPEGGIAGVQVTDPLDQFEAAVVKASFCYNNSGFAGGMLNPLSVDTDRDGLPDPWETEFYGTFTAGSSETVTETKIEGATTTTVQRVVSTGATWNMDGMDATVIDSRLDYDCDGLANWQEYMVGSMRCWRYDDTVTPWGSHAMSTNDIEQAAIDDETWGKFWYDRLVDTESPDYNPTLANGYLSGVSAYFTPCLHEWDPAYGCWYYYRDGIDHDLKKAAKMMQPTRFTRKASEAWGEDTPYDIAQFAYPQKYISCDPRRHDTDFDGMDDYYELFHGMNPILGEAGVQDLHANNEYDAPYDVVYDAYMHHPGVYTTFISGGNSSELLPASAENNWWRNKKANHATVRLPEYKKGSASDKNAGYDFVANPWLNGIAGADPDGDNIGNQEEAIMPKVQAASTYHHTDPTPLWMTDTSYTNALTRKYYRLEPLSTDEDTTSWTRPGLGQFTYGGVTYDFTDFAGFEYVLGTLVFNYCILDRDIIADDWWLLANGWMYSFEENEGYDSDHDFLCDFEEAQGKTKNASDPQGHDDPLRRQAMWFNGTDAFLQTPLRSAEHVPVDAAASEQRQNFLYFTVECWALPDKAIVTTGQYEANKTYTLVERVVYAGPAGPADETYMRRNFLIGVRNGRWYAKFDSTGTDAKQAVEITEGPMAESKWTHLAASFDGKNFVLYANGVPRNTHATSIQPEHGVNALAINEYGEMDPDGGTVTHDDLVSILVGASAKDRQGLAFDWAWRYRSLKRKSETNPEGLAASTTLANYTGFYKGYIDEVRIWDGARTASDILSDYENRVRYTTALAIENRQAVYAKWSQGGLRSPVSTIQLPAQLMYHWAFDHLAGAIQASDVVPVPAGFDTAKTVTDAKARWVRPDDWVESRWANTELRSTVYTDLTWVPWINNTVSHMPRFDKTTLDSVYWSEDYAGSVAAADVTDVAGYASQRHYTSFEFPRTHEVFSRWSQQRYTLEHYYDSHYDRDFALYNAWRANAGPLPQTLALTQKTRWNVLAGYEGTGSTNVVVMTEDLDKYRFAARDRYLVGDDLLPMGGAYPKRISIEDGGMWDNKQGEPPQASDAWAQTGKDSDNNGLPDWWEEYARANYCKNLRPRDVLNWDTIVTYRGVQMTALQAYLRDLANGLVKDGARIYYDEEGYADKRDNDKDGLPDWWEELYGLDTSTSNADVDSDNDGLSNFQEYLLSEVYPLDREQGGYGLADGEYKDIVTSVPRLNPMLAYSLLGQRVPDYFLRYNEKLCTNIVNAAGQSVFYLNEYFGEIVTDHDFMEDWWENLYGIDYVNAKKYDPTADKDGDGWSTWAECRASLWGNSFTASLIDKWTGTESEQYVPCRPQPIIGVKATYYGKQDISGHQLIVRTTSGQRQRTDATFVVPPSLDGQIKFIGGFIADTILHGHMSPGMLNANSVIFERARVSSDKVYTWNCKWYKQKVPNERGWDARTWTLSSTWHSGDFAKYREEYDSWPHVELEGGDFDWEPFADTVPSADLSSADLVIDGVTKFGRINCTTGEYELDMSKFTGEGSVDEYVFRVTYTSRLGHEWPQTVYLSDTKELETTGTVGIGDGYVREGLNTIEAFIDLDGNGAYTAGEPYGVAQNVDVGWHKVPVTTIELRDDSNVMPRYVVASGGGATAQSRKFFVRRASIDGSNVVTTARGTRNVPRPVLANAELVMDSRDYLTEADVLVYNRLDLDWGSLTNHWMSLVGNDPNYKTNDFSKVGYDIVEVVTAADGTTSNAVVKSFVKTFNPMRGTPTAVSPLNGAPVYACSPTFAFSCADDTMTAYRLQIRKAGDTALVYDSGCQRLPARTPNTVGESVYEVTPAIYAGTEVFVGGKKMVTTADFVDGMNYEWRVALFNAKYMSDNDDELGTWSSTVKQDGEEDGVTNIWATFQMDIGNRNRYPQIATGCGNVTLAVRYYGPTNLPETAAIYAEAFENADFRGQPVARAKVDLSKPDSQLGEINDITTNNVKLCGVTPGIRYIRAFIDRNGNGQRDAWESWGYVNHVGKGVKAIYNPVAVEVTTSTADWTTSEVAQYTLFIEDTDVDQNEVPDCLQAEKDFDGLVADDATRDTDGDGLKDYEETFYGTNPKNPDTDGDGLDDYEEVVTRGTSPTKRDTDDDGMDDKWEVEKGTDPTTDDAGDAIPGDVMAYVETGVYLVTYGDKTYAKRWGNDESVPEGETNRLYTTFSYGDHVYVGAPTEWIPEIGEAATRTDKAVLMHAAVYDWFGYDVTTARGTGEGTNVVMGANTKAFTTYDKYVTDVGYLPEFGITYEPVSPHFIDSNNNGIDDGWELYVAMARVAPVKSFPVSNEEQIRHAYNHNYDPYDPYSIFKTQLTDADRATLVPFTNEQAFRMGYADAGSNYWSYAANNDVMALANEQMYVANKEGKLYAIRKDGVRNGVPCETNRLWTTFQLANGQLVLGRPTDLTVADVNVTDGFNISTNVTLIHSGVYDWYGFNATTARAVTNAVNTVPFTRAWKLVTNLAYLPEFGITTEPINLDAIDSNANTIDDGWELYVAFADVAPVKSFPVSNQEEISCASGHNIGGVVFDPYSALVKDEDGNDISNKDAFDYRLFDFASAGEAQLDVESDYDFDGLSNYQEWLAKRDLGLVLDVEDWMTDGETPDYFRVGPNSVKYAGEFYNGAEWMESDVRTILSDEYSSRTGTRYYQDTGWDVWSTARYSINKSDGLTTVTGVSEELMLIIRYFKVQWGSDFNGATWSETKDFFDEQYKNVIHIIAPDGTFDEIQRVETANQTITVADGYRRIDADAVKTTSSIIEFFGGKDAMQRVIAENKKSISGADITTPEPVFHLTLKYAGNETIPVFVEAYQVNGSYEELGEQMTARWNVTPTFKAGIATGIEFSTPAMGMLLQGPARFVAYVDLDGNNALSDADIVGMAEVNVGFEGGNLEITLGTPNAALPVIDLGGSNVVQGVRILRTTVNGETLKKPVGVFGRYFENNVARARLYPSDFVTAGFVGLDRYLAADYAGAWVESVGYQAVDEFGNVLKEFTVKYSETRDKATVNTVSDALVGTGTLSFNVPTGTANTKFWLRYAKDGGAVRTVGGATGIAMPYSADGTVTITLADVIPDLSVGTYTFSVALGNDKYGAPEDEADWCGAVSQYVGADAVRDAGFTVTVRHPTAQADLTNAVVVAAYESADLAEPVAWKVVPTFDGNAIKLDGLVEGKDYYVAAWYVRNLGDNRAHEQYRQPYDTWGYVSALGTNSTCFAARAVEAKANAGAAETVWLQDTFYNDNLIVDREEDMTAVTDSKNAPYDVDPYADFDDDDLPDDVDNDPVFDTDEQDEDDGDDWYDRVMRGDLMAYKDVATTLVALGNDADAANWTWYAVTDPAQAAKLADGSIKLQTPATELTDLATTYAYGKRIGIGRGVTPTAADGVVMATSNATVRLVHAQVFAECGFDTRTVNKAAFLAGEGVNTKPFTRKDKFLVIRYLEAIGVEGIDEKQLLLDLENPLWDLYWNDRYGYDKADTDLDGIVDGWELYTMFGIESELTGGTHVSRLREFLADPFAKSAGRTLADAKVSPFNTADGLKPSPDGGLQLVEEYDAGYWPTDPWCADTDGDNVIDAYAYRYHLKNGESGDDRDGDGLSNYAEYLISKVFKFAELDPDNPKTNGSCVDYFRKVGDLYLGEVFTDHDQVDDLWEQKYATAANRYAYDPSRDDDGDGWSNWAEAKAGTHPAAAQSVGVDGEILKEYPVPAIAAKVVYRGRDRERVAAGNLVFQAWGDGSGKYTNGLEMTTTPDATWIASADGATNVTKYVGVNPGKTMSYYLGTGVVKPGTLRLWFRDAQAENALFRDGVEISTSPGTNPKWYYFVEDVITGNDAGELRLCATNLAPVKVGTIDYATGLATVDFGSAALQGAVYDDWVNGEGTVADDKRTGIPSSCAKIDLSRSFVKIEWTPVRVDVACNATYYLSDATGHVREGRNRFVVFCDMADIDGATEGAWDPGEPFGFVRDVDVGWQGGAFEVELTETTPIFARVDLGATASDAMTDREYFQKDNSTITRIGAEDSDEFCKNLNVHVYGEEKGAAADADDGVDLATRLIRVRVVRAKVDGKFEYEHTYDDKTTKVFDDPHAVVLDKYMDFSARNYLHEGDFLTGGKLDVDWTWGTDEIWKNKRFFDATNVTYLIVLGEGEIGSGKSNAVFRCAVTRTYDTEASRQCGFLKPVIDTKEPGLVYGEHPTFRWTMQDMNGNNAYNSYSAFKIQIGSWTSDFLPAPARDASGWYSWTLDKPLGTLLGTSGAYTWKVAMYNAKFKDEEYWSKRGNPTFWSDAGTLTVDMNNKQPMNDSGYSSIAASVKYTGPWEVLLSGKVVVQAFSTADFAGAPAGATYAADKSDVASPENNAANAWVKGLPQTGTYYLRAFVDSNANGVKDDFESWGAAKEPVTISPATLVQPTAGIWIEDADTDGDWLPDAWEYAKYGNLTAQSAKIIDGDKIVFSGTVDASGTAGISTGLSGASLTIFQNQSFIKTMVGLTDVVSIDDVRAAVEKKVNPNTVKITALTLAPDGRSVTLSVAAEVTDSIAGELLGSLYNITAGDTARVTVKVYKKSTLAEAAWTLVWTAEGVEVGRGDTEVSVPVKGVDMTSGFYKIEVVQ